MTDLSCNGSQYYETPHIDQLKSKGIWFSCAYAGASNSAPSRACMLTGQNTPRHGVYTVGNPDRGKKESRKLISQPNHTSLPHRIQILPKVLKNAGYQTFHIGKWHVTENPADCGIDINLAGNHAGHPRSYFSPYRNANLENGKEGEYLPDRLGMKPQTLSNEQTRIHLSSCTMPLILCIPLCRLQENSPPNIATKRLHRLTITPHMLHLWKPWTVM